GPAHRFDQLVDDVLRRRTVGIAHAEIDDVLAAPPRRHLELGGDVEDIRWQPREAMEFGHVVADVEKELMTAVAVSAGETRRKAYRDTRFDCELGPCRL